MYGMRLFDATIKALHCYIPGSSGEEEEGIPSSQQQAALCTAAWREPECTFLGEKKVVVAGKNCLI